MKIKRDFENGKHDYFVESKSGEVKKAISVNELLKKQKIGFDYDTFLNALPEKKRVELMKDWEIKRDAGTYKHTLMNSYFTEGSINYLQDKDCVFFKESIDKYFGENCKYKSEFPLAYEFDENLILAGTLDLIVNKDVKNYIVDFKSGKPQKEHEDWQLSYYAYLYEKNGGHIDKILTINSTTRSIIEQDFIDKKELEKMLACEARGEIYTSEKKIEKQEKLEKQEVPQEFYSLDLQRKDLNDEQKRLENIQAVKDYKKLGDDIKNLDKKLKEIAINFNLDNVKPPYCSYSNTKSTKFVWSDALLQNLADKYNIPSEELYSCGEEKTTITFRPTPKKSKDKEIDIAVKEIVKGDER